MKEGVSSTIFCWLWSFVSAGFMSNICRPSLCDEHHCFLSITLILDVDIGQVVIIIPVQILVVRDAKCRILIVCELAKMDLR